MGMPRAVSGHLRSVHNRKIVMHHCPFPWCSYKTPKAQSVHWHWECVHQALKSQSKELKTLPPLVALVHNRHFQHPGNGQPLLPPAQLPVDSIPIQQKGELVVGVHRILTPRSATQEEQRMVKFVSPQLTTFMVHETSSHVAEQGIQGFPQAPPPPAAIVTQGTSPPEQKLLKVSPEEPAPALPSTPDHAPSHYPSAMQSPPSPVLTPISIRLDTTSERNWETSPPAMSRAAVSPAATSVVAQSPAAQIPDAVSPALTSQSTPDYSLGSPMKQNSPDLIPILAPESPSIPTPPVPTRVQLSLDLLAVAPAEQKPNPQDRHEEVLARLQAIGTRSSPLRSSDWLLSGIWLWWRVKSCDMHGRSWPLLKSSACSCGVSWNDSVPLGSSRRVWSVTWSQSPHPAPCLFCLIWVSLKYLF